VIAVSALPLFETLVAPHLTDLRKFCFYLTRSKWDAEDLYQDALLKSLSYYMNAGSTRVTKAFLFSAAKLLWIDGYRNRKRRAVVTGADPNSSGKYKDTDYVEIRSIIEWLAELVPDRNIEIWLLYEYFGYSMQEVADLAGLSVGAVKSVLFRTRELLRNPDARKGKPPSKVLHMKVERWVRAVMYEQPHRIVELRGRRK
jgi:RNA polymerase sigma-70 factor (ECF subfamily)